MSFIVTAVRSLLYLLGRLLASAWVGLALA